ncbi:lipid A ethanolaminephosphotransferase [Rhodocyclaceae bacterium]|nr:lipid A ethanolaminephosphotransferase [Rhodocyclaceae bacterium]
MNSPESKREISGNVLLLLTCLLLVAGSNAHFITQVLQAFPPSGRTLPALFSLAVAFLAFNVVLFGGFAFGRMTKPVLIVALLTASVAAYFMDSFGTVVGEDMLRNVAQTDASEAFDLITPRLLVYFILLGVIPSALIWRTPLAWRGWRSELMSRAKLLGLCLFGIVVMAVVFGSFYASFVRGHKSLRTYANPAYFLLSTVKFIGGGKQPAGNAPLAVIAHDAHIPRDDEDRELILLVIGETARADRLSINGYERDTTPRLKEANAVSLTNFWSCGTSTALSVPCMFSPQGMARFDPKKAGGEENLLDVLQRAGVNVLWLDNNSDSKGTALRVPYQSYKTPDINTVCDSECRDEGMLVPLQDYIDSHPKGDIVIILHQMGNHGPAYFKRYPPEFEKFTPACRSKDLSQCTREEIGNAYDNALLYTDHFLGKAIDLLKRNDKTFETALFYLSDHGESLGEGGVYLHGLPRAVAPDSQLHVPAILWFGSGYDELDLPALLRKRHQRFTHDHLFHTLLGFLEVRTAFYKPELDILDGCRKDGGAARPERPALGQRPGTGKPAG